MVVFKSARSQPETVKGTVYLLDVPLPSSKNTLQNTDTRLVEERALLTSSSQVRKTVCFSAAKGTVKLTTDQDGRNTEK